MRQAGSLARARAQLTTLRYLRASFLKKPRRTRRGRFDKVSSYFWFTASEGFRRGERAEEEEEENEGEGTNGQTDGRMDGRAGERASENAGVDGRERGCLSASTIMRVESGWFGGYTGSDTGPKGVVTIRQRCQLLRPQPLNNLPVLTTRPPHRYRLIVPHVT